MKKYMFKSLIRIFLIKLTHVLFLSNIAFGAIPDSVLQSISKEDLASRPTKLLSSSLSKKFEKAVTFLNRENFDYADKVLDQIIEISKKRPYELSKAYYLKGNSQLLQNKYKAAIDNYYLSLKSKGLNLYETTDLLFALARVQLALNEYNDAKTTVSTIKILVSPHPAKLLALSAGIEFSLGNLKEALSEIELALKDNKEPSLSWIKMAASLSSQLGDHKKSVLYSKMLAQIEPAKKQNWKMLSNELQSTNVANESLATLEIGNLAETFSESGEIMQLASSRFESGLTYESANLMSKALESGSIIKNEKNYENLAGLWISAAEDEKAIEALNSASQLSQSGKYDLMIGQIHLEQGRNLEAQKALKKATEKRGFKELDKAYMLLGMAYHRTGNLNEALKVFKKGISEIENNKSSQKANLSAMANQIENEINIKSKL